MSTSSKRIRRPVDIGLPGPTTREMIRDFRSIRADPLQYLMATRERYGDLVAFPVAGPPALLMNDPEDVRRVLQSSARHWTKNTVQYAALGRITGPGLLASSEPSWINHRRSAAPAFHRHRLEAVGNQIVQATDDALLPWATRLRGGAVTDMAEMTLGIALDIVGRALFSADLSDRSRELLKATSSAAQLVVRIGRSVIPVPHWLPTRLNRRLSVSRRQLDSLCLRLITTRRSAGSSGDDLLGLLIESGMTDEEIRDEVVTMVIAGHETVAASLAWTLMLLAADQQAQDRVRAEATELTGPPPMVGSATRTPWTRAVIDEALRLYPPAWVISRRAQLPDVIGGREVPAGTIAIVSPWLLHRRADCWPSPEEFRPDRFLGGSTVRADYLPFGIGPRLCIGREFALGEMVIVLTRVLGKYRLELPANWSQPQPEALIAAHARGGMPLLVKPVERDR